MVSLMNYSDLTIVIYFCTIDASMIAESVYEMWKWVPKDKINNKVWTLINTEARTYS